MESESGASEAIDMEQDESGTSKEIISESEQVTEDIPVEDVFKVPVPGLIKSPFARPTSVSKSISDSKPNSGGFKLPGLPSSPKTAPAESSSDEHQGLTETTDISPATQSSSDGKATDEDTKPLKSPAELANAKTIPIPYQEPSWGGIPQQNYSVEVLKNGVIVDTIKLADKGYFVVGRLANCDIVQEHPSLSRYHAVLQFKSQASPEKPAGFYLYDLDSTHGSFHNKKKCFPKTYYRLRVGHMIKFGGSTRSLILQGPDEDCEDESDLSVSELKSLSAEKLRKKEEDKNRREKEAKEKEEEEEKMKEAAGISWGIGDDGEEFPDMDQNPYAETAENESLYINDPKKALKIWFDREGYDLEYDVTEKGYAQFLCKIDLPVDSPSGVSTTAEALVKGKKKEATVQAALEACRILDRLGLLRPKQETAIERKVKKWEEDDFYASDEDEFLDRTGTISKKRHSRMKQAGKAEEVVETYDSLMKKHAESEAELAKYSLELKEALARKEKADKRSQNLDLDNYLAELKQGAQVDKETIQKLKTKIFSLNQEVERLTKLINIAKPASLPELKSKTLSAEKPKLAGIMIGKRGSKGLIGKMKNVSKDLKNPAICQATDTKVLEAFLEETNDQKPKRSKLDNYIDDDSDDEIQPIGYEARKVTKVAKPRIGDTSVNAPATRVLGPRIPSELLPAKSDTDPSGGGKPTNEEEHMEPTEAESGVAPRISPEVGESPLSRLGIDQPDQSQDEDYMNQEKRKRGDRGSKRRRKPDELDEGEEKQDDYYKVGMDRKYDVWVPPVGQSGDGRTSLNDKLGY